MSFGGTSLQRGLLRTAIGSVIAGILCWFNDALGGDIVPYGALSWVFAALFVASVLGLVKVGFPELEQ